jgi:hypothetical protein
VPSSPPPDRFQREIDDIIRLAERRLEHQSFGHRVRRFLRRIGSALRGISIKLPSPEVLGGWALALLLISWLLTLPLVGALPLARVLSQPVLVLGIVLLVLALITSLTRGRSGSSSGSSSISGGGGGGGGKMWRGERISYGSPYGEGFLNRLRRMFRGGR